MGEFTNDQGTLVKVEKFSDPMRESFRRENKLDCIFSVDGKKGGEEGASRGQEGQESFTGRLITRGGSKEEPSTRGGGFMETEDSLQQDREANAEEIERSFRWVMEKQGFHHGASRQDVIRGGEQEREKGLGIHRRRRR